MDVDGEVEHKRARDSSEQQQQQQVCRATS
jgi:hypothetical protein